MFFFSFQLPSSSELSVIFTFPAITYFQEIPKDSALVRFSLVVHRGRFIILMSVSETVWLTHTHHGLVRFPFLFLCVNFPPLKLESFPFSDTFSVPCQFPMSFLCRLVCALLPLSTDITDAPALSTAYLIWGH